MPRLIASRAELDRVVRRIGGHVDAEDVRAFALGEDELIDPHKLERIEQARMLYVDVASSELWGSVIDDDDND